MRTVGPYRLVELLGRGGMGEVWRARDPVAPAPDRRGGRAGRAAGGDARPPARARGRPPRPEARPGARADLDRAIELSPEVRELWVQRGELRRFARDLPGAAKDFGRALELGEDPPAHCALGELALERGDLEEARRRAEALRTRGEVRIAQRRLEAGLADLTRAQELEPSPELELKLERARAALRTLQSGSSGAPAGR